ncbi:LysR substrate-binding domain-containing protein [Anderseniella sp. Alg231-50]|uniref:LysR substrate-binding domain-containing protein n=1 Tax=Anderseniella sp. Alg231-50 TaxID=1922226 RepID=UPI000D5535AB
MPNMENFRAFVLAAELGSFSAAARQMGKAQSAVSTAIANLEIDADVKLFDRSSRNPVLTEAGEALLPNAKGILLGNQEFLARATSMSQGVEGQLCVAIEQGISIKPLLDLLQDFGTAFAHVSLEIIAPDPTDMAVLLKQGRAELGLMIEQESYPTGFQFRGVGYSRTVPVATRDHPLTRLAQVRHANLREFRELVPQNRPTAQAGRPRHNKSPSVWYAENPMLALELVAQGFGWAELPYSIIADRLRTGELVQLNYAFQQSDILQGVDAVWTEQRALGVAGQWMLNRLLELPQDVWREGEQAN